ncbi:threonine aldolase [Sporolactobacillus sp. THM7-7]|nr:threonine aldolase [Sporolactobacillus sp. THM7-7]
MAMTIDYRTDSGTQPTEEMRLAMYRASVGDDYYGEDPSVNRLEKKAADVLGKEAALLTTTATLGNQLALLATAWPESDIWVEKQSHIASHDYTAFLFPNASFHHYLAEKGVRIREDDIEASCRGTHPVFCLENTHNRHGGTVLPATEMKKVYDRVKAVGGSVHLDGSRLFNASVASGVAAKAFARYADTAVICLCKGLCAPVGAILAGPAPVICQAREWRKKMGSAMPQAGIIAAPAYVALQQMIPRLAEDHRLASRLAHRLAGLPYLSVDLPFVQTNIVLVRVHHPEKSATQVVRELKQAGILVLQLARDTIRFVIDRQIHPEDISRTEKTLQDILKDKAAE